MQSGIIRYLLLDRRLVLLPILFTLTACGPSKEDLSKVEYAPLLREDWPISTPVDQGLSAEKVAELYFEAGKMETLYSLLVVKNGYLVAEDYFNEGAIDNRDRLQSVTKSITSALVGLAIEQGCLGGIEQRVLTFFPEVATEIEDPRKHDITLRELLMMRSGYPREEDDQEYWDGLLSGHYPRLLKEFPLVSDPGEAFHYSNLSSNWLGIIVSSACGMSLKSYAESQLFAPLAIQAGQWGEDAEGNNNGCGDLHLTARAAAKFGLTYLNNGRCNGQQIISPAWVEASLKTYSVGEAFASRIGDFDDIGYGYHWWSARAGDYRVNFAWGHGGQLIVLVADLDMVVVTTSYPFWKEHNDRSWSHERAIMTLVSEFISGLGNE
jgi:CubicO group peptidase (beta-lactamase class C family)